MPSLAYADDFMAFEETLEVKRVKRRSLMVGDYSVLLLIFLVARCIRQNGVDELVRKGVHEMAGCGWSQTRLAPKMKNSWQTAVRFDSLERLLRAADELGSPF